MPTSTHDRPSVSVLIPTLNEASFIHRCLSSVLAQDYPIHEVLVLDGGSTDETRKKALDFGAPVRIVHNPGRGPASALNTGLHVSTGDVICRMDAHTTCATDYVRRCVDVLLETGAEVVGGPMRPQGSTSFGRAVAAVTAARIGMPGRFHFSTTREEVDTVYLGTWRRSTLLDIGGFDEQHFPWWGEDNELNFRIRRAGGRILLDPSIRSTYRPREHPGALWRQYRNYGLAKATSVARHGSLPSWRPLAPAALVAGSAVGLLAGRNWRQRLAFPLLHAAGCVVVGQTVTRRGRTGALRAAIVQEICHWSFGFGFWTGIGRILRGEPVQPTGQQKRAERTVHPAPASRV